MELLKSFLPKPKQAAPQTPLSLDLNVEATPAVWDEIKNYTLLDFREEVTQLNINTRGRLTNLVERYILFKRCPDILSFDIEHVEIAIRLVEEKDLARSSLDTKAIQNLRLSGAEEQALIQSIALLKKLNLSGEEGNLVNLQRLLRTIRDVRNEHLQKSNADISLESICSQELGYTRKKVLTEKDLVKLGESTLMQLGAWRDEYAENEEHLRGNLILLLEDVIKLKKFQKKMQPPEFLKEVGITQPITSMEEILNTLDNLSPQNVLEAWERLNPNEQLSEWRMLETLDSNLQQLHALANLWVKKSQRSQLKIKDLAAALPTLPKQNNGDWHAYIHNQPADVIVCKEIKGNHVLLREIGIRCDGLLIKDDNVLNQDEDWSFHTSERTLGLSWSTAAGVESGITLDDLINNQSILNIATIQFNFEGETYIIDIRKWGVISKHSSIKHKTLSNVSPIKVEQTLTDGKRVVFLRFVMQIIDLSDKAKKYVDLMLKNSFHIQESGAVLVHAFETSISNSIKSVQANYTTLFMISNSLRSAVFSNLNELLRKQLRSSLEMEDLTYDLPLKSETKEILYKLTLAGPEDKHSAIVSLQHVNYANVLVSKCHFLTKSLMLEQSNLQAVLRKLDKYNGSSNLVFCTLIVSGRLSPLDIARIVEKIQRSAIRLLLVNYSQLVYSLQITGAMTMVEVPPSLFPDSQHVMLQPYADNIFSTLYSSSDVVVPADIQPDLRDVRTAVSTQLNWTIEETTWRHKKIENVSTDTFSLLCSSDPNSINAYYNDIPEVKLFNCRSHTWRDLKAKVDLLLSLFEDADINPCIILLNAHLLSDLHKTYIISKSVLSKHKIILVMPHFNSLEQFQSVSDKGKLIEVKAKVIYAQPSEVLLKKTANRDVTENELSKYRCAKLLGGQLIRSDFLQYIQNSKQVAAEHFVKALSSEQSISKNALEEVAAILFLHYPQAKLKPNYKEFATLHQYIAAVSLSSIYSTTFEEDITFENFVKFTPICQLVSQAHRIVFYLREILKVHEAEQAVDYFAKKGSFSNVHSPHLLGYMVSPKDSVNTGEVAQYSIVQHDSGVDFVELVSQQCIQGHELDWNTLASTWKVFPYSADFLMALLATYPYKLKLLCTLSFSTILHTIENGGTKWAEVVLDISRLVKQVDSLLNLFAPIASYISVLKWGLLLHGMTHINFNEKDVKVLIENRIPLSILTGMEARIIPIILSLDGPPDVIYQQIQLREYFLNLSPKILKDVAHGKPKLGLAFLDFIFHPLIRDSEEAKGCSVLQLDDAKLLLGWLRHAKHNLTGLRGRFTDAAAANLVCRATSNDHIELLWTILQANDCSNIIKLAISQQHSQQQILRLLELISKEKGKGALKISATTDVEKFYSYLYLALSENQFDLLMESVANLNGGVNLPIALSTLLLELYIQYFSDKVLSYPTFNEKMLQQAIRIAVLAVSESGSNAVLEKLKLSNSDGYKGIGMIHWLLCPYQPLPFTLTTEDAKLLRDLSKRELINFSDRVQKNLAVASNYALYLEAPYYLSLSVVNFYRKLEGQNQIGEVPFIVAQKGDKSTPYCITVPETSLPKEYLETIETMTFNIQDEADYISALKFMDALDITSGVNIEKIETNLSALCLLDRVEFDEQKNATIGKEEVTATQVYIANCIFAWFWACGIPSQTVEALLTKSLGKLPKYFDKLKIYSDLTRATLFPLPSVVNCTLLRDITGLPLFGTSREASLFTYQIFYTSVERFNPDFPAPYDLLRSTSKTLEEFERTTEYDTIHRTIARIVAEQLAKEIVKLGKGVDFTALETIGRSLYQMIHNVNNPEYPWHHSIERRDVVSQMMQLILEDTFAALSTTKGEWQAVLSRILIGQIGFSGNTRDTFTQVVSIIIKFYIDKGAALCKQTYQELSFIIANGFASLSVSSNDPPLVYLQRDFGGLVDLTYKSISTRGTTKSTCRYIPPHRQQSTDAKVKALAGNEKHETTVLFKLPEHSHAATANTTSTKPNFIDSATISQPSDIHVFQDMHHIVIYCHDLLEFQPNSAGFASIIVRAGLETCLIRHPRDLSTFLITKRDAFTTPQGEFGAFADGEICSIFASNGVAWEFIDKQTPSGTVLATSAIFLKKSNDSLSWIPMILSSQPISSAFDDVMQAVFFWKLVFRFELLNYSLPPTLVEFLLFLCKVVHKLLCEDEGEEDPSDQEILSVLARLEIENPVQLLEIASRLDIIKTIISTALKTKRPLQSIITEVLRAEEQQDYFPVGFEQELGNLLMKNSAPKMLAHIENILERRILPKIFFASSIATSDQLINSTHIIARTLLLDIKTVTEDVSAQIFDDDQNADENENEHLNESSETNIHYPFGENTQRTVGYGTATSALQQVISIFDDNPNLYFNFMDPVIHKMNYDAVKGMAIGYILSGNLYNNTGYPNNSYTKWLVDVLRSPLSELLKRWFLQMCCIPMGKDCPLEDNLRGSTIISYCLAEYCPVPPLRERLLGATSLHKGIESFCQRKNGKYGIYFCNSHTLHLLQEKRFNIEIVDLGATAMSKDASSDEIYLQIIGSFKEWTTIVYVQGLALIEDIILKWCCEYTERCPWRFIYFENTNSAFNFAENRDRCNYMYYERPSLNEMCNRETEIGVQEINFHSKQLLSLEDAVEHLCGKELLETETDVEWVEKLRTAFDKYKTFVFFIFGPPGAGKTFMLERIINEKQGELHAVRIDCSNDDLLEVSMEDVLQQKFPKQKKSLLVADEFHMLSKEQKKAMFKWVSERLSWVKVVAIGNRSVEHDYEIANALKLSTDKDVVHIFNVRLNIDQIGQIHSQRSKDVINFLKLWNICSRALFGEESISLRNLEKLAHIYETQGYSAEHSLATFLLDKIPMLGSYTCWQFTHFVLELTAKKDPEPAGNMPPFQLLVFAASLDKTAKICSYPEFVRLTKQSHEFHPIVRLATWVSMAYKKANLKQPHFDSLRQLLIIDQVGFPLILSTSSRSYPLSSVKGFAKYGDFNNLAWMADAIQHGYAMDWNQAKKAWGEQYITSFADFSHLLSVCPDPVVCLTAIHPKNLALLIESSRSAEFCKTILKWYPTNRIEGDMFHSPVNTAAWLLLRNQPAPYEPRLIQTINKDLSQLKVLIWASKAGIFNLTVNDDIEGRTNFIRSLLIAETSALFEGKKCSHGTVNIQDQHIKNLIDLWSNLFAPLLEVGLINGGIPYEAGLILAATQYPANSRWPDLIHRLGKIIYRQGGLEDAEALLDHNFFVRVEERYAHDPNHAVKIPNILVPGLLSIKNLHKKWQIILLETEGVHIPNEFCTAEGLSNLQLGIAQLRNIASLRIAQGPVRKKIEEIIKLRDDTRITKFTYDIEHQKQIRRMNGMKYLKLHSVKNPNILRYYNQYAGAKISELKKGVQFELDQYKNPKGSEFDLGRQGAFGEFRILVGNFYSDNPEFNKKTFDMYAKRAMETKGFSLDYVETEEEFMTKLNILVYDQAWIISSHAADWHKRMPKDTHLKQWRQLANVCEKFWKQGGGLFILGENEPFFDHANVVLERFTDIPEFLKGNEPGGSVLDISKFQHEHLLLSGLDYIFEGITICHAPKPASLSVLIRASTNNPIIMYKDMDQTKAGRIVVDCGYTKMWMNWEHAGTERYFCNVAVWLLGLDFRLDNKLPIRGPINSLPTLRVDKTPAQAPKEFQSPADVFLVIDGSGSVGAADFEQMRTFSEQLIRNLEVNQKGVHFGVIQFASNAQIISKLSYNLDGLVGSLRSMPYFCGGTCFDVALQAAERELLFYGRSDAKKIIIFQTDGEDSSSKYAPTVLGRGITIFVIGVGPSMSIANRSLQALTCPPYEKHIFAVSDYSKIANIKNALMAAVKTL